MRTLTCCMLFPLLMLLGCGGDEERAPVGTLGDPCAPEGALSGELRCRNGRWQRERSGPGPSTTSPSCTSETDAAFCARLEACSLFSGFDSCGRSRTVSCAPFCIPTKMCPGGCLIDETCYPDGFRRPGMPCQRCDASAAAPDQWQLDPPDTPCDSTLNMTPQESAGCAQSACTSEGLCRADAIILPTRCLIAGACRMADASSSINTCHYCDPTLSQRDWSLREAGTMCSSERVDCSNNQCQCTSVGECVD